MVYKIGIKQLLEQIEYISFDGDENAEICGITNDSRCIEAGFAYVCIKGFNADGHVFAPAAEKNGATLIVAENDYKSESASVLRVENSRKAMAQIASALYDHPSKKLKLIGVTGTNGKTTTTHIIKSVLDLAGKKTGLIGTNHTLIGESEIEAKRTTPESCQLHKWFAMMVDAGVQYCIMEVSSHSVELLRVYGITFDVGVFTNLTHDHLDLHGDMETYMQVKTRMLDACKTAIINIDDEYGKKMSKLTKCKNVLTYSSEKKADYMAENINLREHGIIYDLKCEKADEPVKIKAVLPGRFSVYNTLGAAAACFELGFGSQDVQRGIIITRGAKGRAELVQVNAEFKIMIDYAHTPDGLYNILTTVREFTQGRVITVFGAAGDRDRAKRPEMGKLAGNLSDYCIITSDNPASEEPADIIKAVEDGVKETECSYVCIEDRKQAIIRALEIAQAGDLVMLAGKGHETYQIVKGEYIPFSEEQIVKDYFNKR